MSRSVSEAEQGRRVMAAGVTVFRWAALGWMIALALTAEPSFSRPGLAWTALGVAGAWTAYMTVPGRERSAASLWIELALAFSLNAVGGLVVAEQVVVGGRPFFATAWPAAAVVSWGVGRGPVAGILSGAVLGLGLLLSRALNGIPVEDLTSGQIQSIVNGSMTYIIAGGTIGAMSRLFDRSEAQFRALVEETMAARERAARLAGRERLARQIHDSVLQALAMVHKRGRELARGETVAAAEVAALAETAGKQEEALRALIMREPEEAPMGRASLREALEAAARATTGVGVRVSAVGPIHLDAHVVAEITDAVRQALDNVVEHAGASRVTVFAEMDGDEVVVSVRDDGRGFVYDEARLRAAGAAGVLKSMKGRVESLGGVMTIESAPGAGTEVELRVPVGGGSA